MFESLKLSVLRTCLHGFPYTFSTPKTHVTYEWIGFIVKLIGSDKVYNKVSYGRKSSNAKKCFENNPFKPIWGSYVKICGILLMTLVLCGK